jgi:DNA-binding protein HU-beta
LWKKPEKPPFFTLVLFTSAVRLPYDDLDPASRTMIKQNRAAMFFQKGRTENQPMAEAAARMTQTQIVKELAESTGVGNKVAKQFLEKFTEIAVRETKKKGVFVMPGIGRLVRVERKARTGRNPATGESIKIPAKKVVKFRIAKAVKDAIVPPKAAKK